LRGPVVALVWTLAVIALAIAVGPAPARGEQGLQKIATWYGNENGSDTASGEPFNPDGFCADYPQVSCTCAHRFYPFGTYLTVRWQGRSVVVRVTDRGPNVRTGADIDLSKSAARRLGMLETGRAHVTIERVERME
jgi:rare lipoprotein A